MSRAAIWRFGKRRDHGLYESGRGCGNVGLLAALSALVMCSCAMGKTQNRARPEIRAFWADGFADDLKSSEGIDLLLRRVREAHCNAIFAQVRKSGDAIYLSRYDPWAHDDPQHFDLPAFDAQVARWVKRLRLSPAPLR